MPQRPGAAPPPGQVTASDAEIDVLISDEEPDLFAWLAHAPVATRARGPQ